MSSNDHPIELMLSEKILRERINKILDLVSAVYPRHTLDPNSPMVRCTDDDEHGENDIIIDKAIKILKGENIE